MRQKLKFGCSLWEPSLFGPGVRSVAACGGAGTPGKPQFACATPLSRTQCILRTFPVLSRGYVVVLMPTQLVRCAGLEVSHPDDHLSNWRVRIAVVRRCCGHSPCAIWHWAGTWSSKLWEMLDDSKAKKAEVIDEESEES